MILLGYKKWSLFTPRINVNLNEFLYNKYFDLIDDFIQPTQKLDKIEKY